MALKAILFDVDGTLLDTENMWKKAMEEAEKEFGLVDLETNLLPRLIGKSEKEEDKIYKEVLPDEIRDEFINYWRKIGFEKIEKDLPVKAGTYEIFDYIKQKGLSIGVGTSTSRVLTEQRLSRIGILKDIDYLVCGFEIKNKKPSPDVYLELCKHFKISGSEALVIEDSAAGVEAAYRAGIPCIQVIDLIPPTDIEKKHTIYIANSLKEVINKIEEIYYR